MPFDLPDKPTDENGGLEPRGRRKTERKEGSMTDVRDRIAEADEAVREATTKLNAALAERGRILVLEIADKAEPKFDKLTYSIDSEYNDEGGYYLVATFYIDGDYPDDSIVDDLYEIGAETAVLLANPPESGYDYRESEGTITIERLRTVTF